MKRVLSFFLAIIMIIAVSPRLNFAVESNPFASLDDFRQEHISASSGAFTGVTRSPANMPMDADRYIVTFRDNVSLEDIHGCVKNYAYRLLADSNERVFSLYIDSLADFRNEYAQIIADIKEDTKLSLSAVVDDPLASNQWELDFLDMYDAWDIPSNGKNITVAILDSGIYRNHEEFINVNILNGYDAVYHSVGIDFDANGHGTQVCSIIAAERNNLVGMCGIAENVSILPIRVSDESGYIHSSDFIEAVYYAADAGVDVINMSFGGYIYSAQEESAMRYAAEKGCICISAAGNEATSPDYAGMKSYPASYAEVISVGACDSDGSVCSFSQHNDAVDMLAPGHMITVANTDGGYELTSGTSYACAYVSGIVALALSSIDIAYSFTADQFTSFLAYLRHSERDNQHGFGAINALSILGAINVPMVSGVIDGGVYIGNISIDFNRGIASLDGKPFLSGDSVIVSGAHNLSITENNATYTYEFITDNIPLQYDFEQNSDNAVFTFKRGTATVDGLPYVSGTPIVNEGKHLFEITGPYGNSESYEFTCEFEAPEIIGVANGERYDSSVSITVPKGGVVMLDDKMVDNNFIVTENGKHTVISTTADGEKSRKVTFYINNKDSKVYKATVANAHIISDETYGFILMYNDFLSGTRVLTTKDPNSTRSFIRTESSIIGHSVTDDNIILLHYTGVSVVSRKEIAEEVSVSVKYIPFKAMATSAYITGTNAYYIIPKGNITELRCLNAAVSSDTLLASISSPVKLISGDENEMVIASDSDLFVYKNNGKLSAKREISSNTKKLISKDGYICTENFVYDTNKLEKKFSLFANETPIKIYNGMLFTNKSIYDLTAGIRLASFSSPLHDIDISENGTVYKSLPEMEFEIIQSDGNDISLDNCAKRFNAAIDGTPLFKDSSFSSLYVCHAKLLPKGSISDFGIDKEASVIYAVSKDEHELYFINGVDMSLIKTVKLRFAPSSICFDGTVYYVSFENEDFVFTYSAKNNKGIYHNASRSYKKLYYKKTLFGLTAEGDLYTLSNDNSDIISKPVILSQNVAAIDAENGFVYAYLKPASVSMVYKINIESGKTVAAVNIKSSNGRIFVDGGKVFIGKTVLNGNDLSTLYRLSADISYADKNYIITVGGLYMSSDGSILTKCTVPTDAPMFDENYNYYNFSEDIFTKILNVRNDLHSAPIIEGVTNGEIYEESVTINYAYGTAYLDGKIVASGTSIRTGGRHTLVLALPFGVNTSVSFSINANISGIDIYADKTTLKINESTRLNVLPVPSSYGTVDVVFTSDNANVIIADDGTIIGAAEGECIITATTPDGKHSDSIKIKVVKTIIELNSSFFDMLDDGKTVRVSAGTSIGMLYEAISNTPGNSGVFSADGIRVDGGVITTGMILRLYDMQENVIDERYLSILGDVDCDGYITANDYSVIQQISSNPGGISTAIFSSADTDNNGVINAFDLLNIKEHLLNVNIIDQGSPLPERQAKATIKLTSPPSVSPSSSFTVGILLTEATNVASVNGKLIYDPTVLSFDGAEIVGDRWNGSFEAESGQISFFSFGRATGNTRVIMLVNFTVMPNVDINSLVSISVKDITIYDGSAALIANNNNNISVSEQAMPYIVIHNPTDFVFDVEQTAYNLHLGADAERVYISVSPSASGEIAGSTSFGNGLETSFSVVLYNGEEIINQYDFVCTKDRGSAQEKPPAVETRDNNSTISTLTVKNGYLAPDFSPDVYEYYLICEDTVLPDITAIPQSDKATVTISDIDTNASRITVICIAEDGSKSNYILNIRHGNPAGNSYIPAEKTNTLPYYFYCGITVFVVSCIIAVIFLNKKKKQ